MKKRGFSFLLLSTLFISLQIWGCSSQNTPPQDGDGDGIADQSDNCPTLFNPTTQNLDEDGDGVGDFCEGLPQPHSCEELLQCESMEDCFPYFDAIVAACPNPDQFGEDPFNLFCCDNRCALWDPLTGNCPAGTCFTPGGHCNIDADCTQEFQICLEGCCVFTGEDVCPNGEPRFQCCPPEMTCEEPAFPPCPEGQTCDSTGCCVEAAGLCGNGICEKDLGECDGCSDCTPTDCSENPSCGEFPACEADDPQAKGFCGQFFKNQGLPPGLACCEETGCCNHCNIGGCGCGE